MGRIGIVFLVAACLLLSTTLVFAAQDPIIGTWKRMQQYGSFEDVRTFHSDGTATLKIMGQVAKGTWKRKGDRYFIKPGSTDDYAIIEGGVLETYDRDGLIAKYSKVK